jgi:hypothetical protein
LLWHKNIGLRSFLKGVGRWGGYEARRWNVIARARGDESVRNSVNHHFVHAQSENTARETISL